MADDIRVRLSPEGQEQVKAAFRQVESESKRSSKAAAAGVNQLNKSLAGLKRQVIGVVGAYASFRGIQSLFGGVIRATIEQEKAIAAVESRIRSTGGAAGVTSAELVKMAGDLQAATTFGDEDILNAQAQLLTFTKVTRENFGAATEAVLNLSQVMGTDLRSSVVQIGKALNDPIAGLTSLTRSGIQFTAAQRETIRSLVETGRTAEAQRVILGELETQFGGAARAARNTLGGAFKALKNAAGDLMEADGASLPGITGAINDLTDTLNDPAVREGFQAMIGAVLTITRVAAEAVTEIANLGQQIGFFAASVAGSTSDLDVLEQRLREVNRALSSSFMGRPLRFLTTSREELKALKAEIEATIALARGGDGIAPPVADPTGGPPVDIDRRLGLRSLQSELAAAGIILADELRRARAALDAELEAGLITYADYFERRAALEVQQIDQGLAQRRNALALLNEEIRLLDLRGESIAQQEGQRKQLVAEITVLERQRGDVGVRAAQDLAKAEKALAREREAFERKFLEIQGQGREARLRSLDEELEGYRRMMTAQGMALEEIEARLGRFRELVVVRMDFDQAIQDGQQALQELDQIRSRIRQDVDAGLLSEFQAEKQIIGIEQERLVLLQEIAAAALASAQALGDPAAIAAAEGLNQQIRQLAIGVNQVAKDAAALEAGFEDSFRGSLQGVLSEIGRDINSVSDAVTAFASNFARQMQNIAAEILARRTTFALLDFLGGSFTGIGRSAPAPTKAATGGYIRGPGTKKSDSIPIMASNKEFMVQADVVEEPGVLPFLYRLNRYGRKVFKDWQGFSEGGLIGTPFSGAQMPRFSARIPKFNAGGLVTAGEFGRRRRGAGGSGGSPVSVTVVADDPRRYRESEGRIAAATANAMATAANRNN